MNITELKDFQIQKVIGFIEQTYNQTIAEKFVALAQHLDLTLRELLIDNELEVDADDITFTYGRNEYKVMTDDEAEDAFDEYLEQFLAEIVYPEIPECYHIYFDEKSWKEDEKVNQSRGRLAWSDDNEHEKYVNKSWYYIYRTK